MDPLAKEIRHIGDIYMLFAGIFNLVMGIVGNLLMILVFTTLRIFKGNQSAFYLTIESISNIGLLLVLHLPRILNALLGYDLILTSLNLCKIRAMLTQIFALSSLFTVCFLSFDQYLSTNLNYYWRQMSTIKLAYPSVIIIITFAILHSALFFIFTENQISMGCTVYNPIMKSYLSFFYYPILIGFLPLIITVGMSLLAYRNVRRIIRRQVPIVRRRLDRQMTAITLARVIVLIVGGVPFICISLYEFNIDPHSDRYLQLAIVYLISSILYSLLYTNFAVNCCYSIGYLELVLFQISFYVFLLVSSRFRRQAKSALCKICCRAIKWQCERPRMNENRISPEIPQASNSAHDID